MTTLYAIRTYAINSLKSLSHGHGVDLLELVFKKTKVVCLSINS